MTNKSAKETVLDIEKMYCQFRDSLTPEMHPPSNRGIHLNHFWRERFNEALCNVKASPVLGDYTDLARMWLQGVEYGKKQGSDSTLEIKTNYPTSNISEAEQAQTMRICDDKYSVDILKDIYIRARHEYNKFVNTHGVFEFEFENYDISIRHFARSIALTELLESKTVGMVGCGYSSTSPVPLITRLDSYRFLVEEKCVSENI